MLFASSLRARYLVGMVALTCATLASSIVPVRSVAAQSVQSIASAVFTEVERQLIRDYYAHLVEGARHGKGKGGKLPPGLARKGELPPGLANQIRKGGSLPPGLAKKALPADLERRLPVRAGGWERVIAGDQILLIDRATNIVRDVLIIADILDRMDR